MDVTPHAVTEVFLNFSRAKSTVVTPATTGSPGEEDLVRGTKRTRRIFGAVENNPVRCKVGRDSGNLVDPFMRVTNQMTRHLATLRES